MKRIISFLLLSMPLFAAAQKTHTVAAKESFYSIGRLYNVHPKDLASFNNIPFEKGLSIGQVIKIPASGAAPMPVVPAPAPTTVVKTETVKAEPVKPVNNAKSGNPVYHTVAPKEGLYGISKKYNVTIADIKKWNNLSSDAVSIGANLIVGFGGNAPAQPTETIVVKQVPEAPVVTKKEEPKVTEVKKAPEPKERPAATVSSMPKEAVVERGNVNYNGGVFKAGYNEQVKNNKETSEAGTAGVFKSTSGWDDGKYYCLHNSAPAGSFVKITNTSNGKSVYAKVLDLIPDLKQNNDLVVRVSNAAATELGVSGNSTFDCKLQF